MIKNLIYCYNFIAVVSFPLLFLNFATSTKKKIQKYEQYLSEPSELHVIQPQSITIRKTAV